MIRGGQVPNRTVAKSDERGDTNPSYSCLQQLGSSLQSCARIWGGDFYLSGMVFYMGLCMERPMSLDLRFLITPKNPPVNWFLSFVAMCPAVLELDLSESVFYEARDVEIGLCAVEAMDDEDWKEKKVGPICHWLENTSSKCLLRLVLRNSVLGNVLPTILRSLRKRRIFAQPLELFDLSGCHLKDESADMLKKFLLKTRVEHLLLDGNEFSIEGILNIITAAHQSGIPRLSLVNSKIPASFSSANAECLAKALIGVVPNSAGEIDMSGLQASMESRQKLCKALVEEYGRDAFTSTSLIFRHCSFSDNQVLNLLCAVKRHRWSPRLVLKGDETPDRAWLEEALHRSVASSAVERRERHATAVEKGADKLF